MGRPHGRHDNISRNGDGRWDGRAHQARGRRGMAGFLPAIATAAVLGAGGTVAALAASSSAGPSLTVSYETTSSWDTGYTGQYTITNYGAAATAGWTLGFRLPGGASLTDVRMDMLRPSETVSHCPYKGSANYWSVDTGAGVHQDIVWIYRAPLPESQKVAGLACFYDEQADVYLDGELQAKPKTPFS